MKFFLFDHPVLAKQLMPFTLTRPVGLIRMGIFTMAERWALGLGNPVHVCGSDLTEKIWPFPRHEDGLWINSAWIPEPEDLNSVLALETDEAMFSGDILLAYHSDGSTAFDPEDFDSQDCTMVRQVPEALVLHRPWHIFSWNGRVIRQDFEAIRKNRVSGEITDPFTNVYNRENVFVEEGADIKAAILNASDGPIYIGRNAQVQEGAIIKGPFALLDSAVINMGAKIRPDTTIGPFCKVGGEVNNSVLFGFSNKAHEGFLGNSVLGEWCNLGADTNNSNLKNNYGEVKVWSMEEEEAIPSGLQFCGLMMGDHSKSGINTMFNTGTVVGVACNLFDGGFPPTYIPSFTWGGIVNGFEIYRFDKFLEAEERVYSRRNRQLSQDYRDLLQHIFIRAASESR
jgi:UDP-N-acetylglucosamine diphosphorylase/glucosamine-1-phosphate N-acetyltransferase